MTMTEPVVFAGVHEYELAPTAVSVTLVPPQITPLGELEVSVKAGPLTIL
jgi:hypothetical protein